MARKTSIFVADSKRDAGKQFLLTEMPASRAEKWGMRALLALMRGGVEVPDDLASMGLAGIAIMGVQALSGLDFELAEPLIDEMFACIAIIPDPKRPDITRGLVEDDIEEIATRLKLRKAILDLHIDFFTDAGLLQVAKATATATAAATDPT